MVVRVVHDVAVEEEEEEEEPKALKTLAFFVLGRFRPPNLKNLDVVHVVPQEVVVLLKPVVVVVVVVVLERDVHVGEEEPKALKTLAFFVLGPNSYGG